MNVVRTGANNHNGYMASVDFEKELQVACILDTSYILVIIHTSTHGLKSLTTTLDYYIFGTRINRLL